MRPAFKRFKQKHDVFCRAWWDDAVKSAKTQNFFESYRRPLRGVEWRQRGDGFTQRDFAVRNASWHIMDLFLEAKEAQGRREGMLDHLTPLRAGPSEKAAFASPRAASTEMKRVAKAFGADLVGITGQDERWVYETQFGGPDNLEKPADLPRDLHNVIVVAKSMDRELVQTVPSALSGAATGLGYGEDVLVILSLAQYIQNLGYKATPSLNDTSIAIPYAVKAGLGEYGRMGLLITKKFGPRVRLGKIYTNMDLQHDKPISFGVKDFCAHCRECSTQCPAKAIAQHEPSFETYNVSNIQGVKKWTTDAEKCFKYWSQLNSDCSVCIRVCPYNRGQTWWDRTWVALAAVAPRAMLWLDQQSNRGKKLKPKQWWAAGAGAPKQTITRK